MCDIVNLRNMVYFFLIYAKINTKGTCNNLFMPPEIILKYIMHFRKVLL